MGMFGWFVHFFRMLFREREPVVADESLFLADKSRQGFVEEIRRSFEKQKDVAVEEPPVIKEPFPLEKLPCEVVAQIASKLQFTDLVSFRQTNPSLNQVFRTHRTMMKGAEIHVFVSIEDGAIVTSFRGHRQIIGSPRPVPATDRNMIFCNSDVTLTLRLGNAHISEETANEIRQMFLKSKLQRAQLKAETVTRETMDLLNAFNCSVVQLDIGRFDEHVLEVRNMNDLKIRENLMFFDLTPIFKLMLPSLSLRVTGAALPGILQCIDEWRASRREILSWFFKIPVMERNDVHNMNDVRIDWRRSMILRNSGAGRLLNLSRITAPEEGDEFVYQTISYLQQP